MSGKISDDFQLFTDTHKTFFKFINNCSHHFASKIKGEKMNEGKLQDEKSFLPISRKARKQYSNRNDFPFERIFTSRRECSQCAINQKRRFFKERRRVSDEKMSDEWKHSKNAEICATELKFLLLQLSWGSRTQSRF